MHVEQDHLRLHPLDPGHGLGHGPGLAHHVDPRLPAELGAHAAAEHRVVVDEEDPTSPAAALRHARHSPSSGISIPISVPLPRVLRTVTVPPRLSTR